MRLVDGLVTTASFHDNADIFYSAAARAGRIAMLTRIYDRCRCTQAAVYHE